MKKVIFGAFLAILLCSASTTYAADTQIKVDGISVVSDVKPEFKNNRTMVPLRVISENLGATVNWSNSEVTLTKDNMKVILTPNSTSAKKNGEKITLDVKPYVKNNRVIVPLRFIAETFGCKVDYSNSTVTVDTAPLVIDGVKIKALQYEYHMTMGGVVQQINGNAYNEAIYHIISKNKGTKVKAPDSYSWMVNIDTPGSYYKNGQYDFLDEKGNSAKQYDIYSLVTAFPDELLSGYPEVLIYDASEDQWYMFSNAAGESIRQMIDTAEKNGFLKVISNNVV
ncbi:copper amine oxidase N-terminal domain-containing protein [Paenibacillus sp. MER TA 81-3]|uniref:copper amine oxidase N-terminal domain-containing protein n=1 Tax=Paenibacillus sp. MER TA 81-3 TaxID=2939573 RepID=UPI002041DF85|nr:copper amine oxidase N-terminal domain-containing protein [Paenibacillus sp. MER TA 81-3]MCM3342514.1 copper amine oxidase N-terminal domain-containing protein [Paenibacillus sp. MER TA 81-3]